MPQQGYCHNHPSSSHLRNTIFIFFSPTQVTPFHPPGSPGALLEAKTGVFKPAPPFSSFRAIPTKAAIVGGTLAIQKLTSKSMELIRGRQDWINEVVGFAVTYQYCTYFLWGTEKRLLMHNRVVGGIVVTTMAYGAWIV